ncbi:MAG: helix-turn-helix transcriptional regulator [Desulfuromonadaceae bacterium]
MENSCISASTVVKTKPVGTLPQTGFVRLPVVLAAYPISKSTWWAGIKSGRYPAGVKLSERTTAWRVEDIRALIQSAGV